MHRNNTHDATERPLQSEPAAPFPHIALLPSSFTAAVVVKELDEVQALATCARYGIPVFWRA
ncbi:hypothetical protein [Variovorax sp. Sphag1AA]|uniref:hypothetical protein n=1 Tax=Variovorax sp. Sphag1AA TaxID=2587027 RepID=UPI00160988B7|nr:hypothetical protein [Variovorax sp. Sphag1AA]MBB3178671.1 hypothetical protein [Variovorax sp. Sphag1AA]